MGADYLNLVFKFEALFDFKWDQLELGEDQLPTPGEIHQHVWEYMQNHPENPFAKCTQDELWVIIRAIIVGALMDIRFEDIHTDSHLVDDLGAT